MKKASAHIALSILALSITIASAQSLPLAELRALGPVAAHPCDAEYYQPVMYANAIFPGADAGTWNEFDAGSSAFGVVTVPTFGEARFDAHGYPKTLAAGKNLGMNPWGLNIGYFNRPADWPEVNGAAIGEWCVTWKGRADVRLSGGSPQFRAAKSNTGATGLATDGRRVYSCPTTASLPNKIILHALDSANPPTDIKVWLPDPAEPLNQSLERPRCPTTSGCFIPCSSSASTTGPGPTSA